MKAIAQPWGDREQIEPQSIEDSVLQRFQEQADRPVCSKRFSASSGTKVSTTNSA
ncbi:MAG: hypothetical protein RIM23_10555 [Coleofasciculus sp. G3-WIS-01]|uniref:hypothetical protein n=1 Tax=Coleofasciculus sp. G3-WIS-01 TaxID=3069528 RepID=UPI0032F59B2A